MTHQLPYLQKLRNLLEMNLYFGKSIDENATDTKKVIFDNHKRNSLKPKLKLIFELQTNSIELMIY
jgi:hypothetical protein